MVDLPIGKICAFDEVHFHEDDRAQRLLDAFDNMRHGQVNVSFVNSTSHIVAWHAHRLQTDYWICLKGSFKVGLAERFTISQFTPLTDFNVKFEYLSDKNFRVLRIPTGVYHGYRALEAGSILLYFMTEKYDPDDEHRLDAGSFGENWETDDR